MKLGILGGTFNPIHNGHTHIATECKIQLELDKVLLIPTNTPPHKEVDRLEEGEHRLNMCRLAVKGLDGFEVSDIELRREGNSYTVDTLRELSALYPDDQLYFLMGSDMFLTLEQWREPEVIFTLCTLCGAARGHGEVEKLRRYAEELEAKGARCEVVDIRPMPMSSTRVRSSILSGGGASREVVSPRVYDYIWQNGLYGLDCAGYPWNLALYNDTAKAMLKEKRYLHSHNVAKEAVRLAKLHGADTNLAYIAGLLHDICKNMPEEEQLQWVHKSGIMADKLLLDSPQVWHGIAASVYLRDELNIFNVPILSAVGCHTTGKGNMSLLDKIIYMADLTSEDRDYDDVEHFRTLATENLDEAMRQALAYTVAKQKKKGRELLQRTKDACADFGVVL